MKFLTTPLQIEVKILFGLPYDIYFVKQSEINFTIRLFCNFFMELSEIHKESVDRNRVREILGNIMGRWQKIRAKSKWINCF